MKKQIIKILDMELLDDRIIILESKAEDKTAGGIIIPDTAQEKPAKGYVVAKGPGVDPKLKMPKHGALVLYGKYSGTGLKYEGEEYVMMRRPDIIAILPEPKTTDNAPGTV